MTQCLNRYGEKAETAVPPELNKRDKSAGITACCGQLDHMWKML